MVPSSLRHASRVRRKRASHRAGRPQPPPCQSVRRSGASVVVAVGFVAGPTSSADLPSPTPDGGGRPGTVRHIVLTERGCDRRERRSQRHDGPLDSGRLSVLRSVDGAPTLAVGGGMRVHILLDLERLMPLCAFLRKYRAGLPLGAGLAFPPPAAVRWVGRAPRGSRPTTPGPWCLRLLTGRHWLGFGVPPGRIA
jgi:hypothetical protein